MNMKSVSLILFGLLAIAQGRTFDSVALGKPRIINGEEAKLGEMPFMVSINFKFHGCGGAIINERWVVTAARCVQGTVPYVTKIVVGTISLKEPYATYQSELNLIHVDYEPRRYHQNNIGLVKVTTPIKFSDIVKPVALPPLHSKVATNSVAILSGWGTLIDGTEPDKLQKLSYFITDQEYCSKAAEEQEEKLFPTNICAHDPSAKKGQCWLDLGSPLTVNGVLEGIVSWRLRYPACTNNKYPDVYTRVSEYIDWIDEQIKAN